MNQHIPLLFIAWLGVMSATGARAEEALPPPAQLPEIKQLPDPFLCSDGSRVKSAGDWKKRREEIRRQLLFYEFGAMPAAPGNVKGVERTPLQAKGIERDVQITMGPDSKLQVQIYLTLPEGNGPFPVIVKGDLCWGRVPGGIAGYIVKHEYALAEFDRTQFAPDSKDRGKGIFPLYPDSEAGDLSAWAWGFSRVIDYLVTRSDIDAKKIVVTGHSRGGKAALLAGAMDDRVALTVPNGSGCGGAGCYRVNPPKTETLAIITDHFPNWFTPRFREFLGQVDRLPFDHHELKALVAPRALLSTDALGDVWANPTGTEQTYQAAKVVFDYLGAGDKIGLHFREGGHDQNAEDFEALVDFADHLFFGKPLARKYDQIPVPPGEKAWDWAAPSK